MASSREWEVPASVQPRPQDYGYDLERALRAVVAVRANVPADAFTAGVLGTERAGNGVLVRSDGVHPTPNAVKWMTPWLVDAVS